MSVPQIIYFDISFWKGEVPRILLHMSGKEFEDKRLTKDMFDAMKKKGELPLGQVPLYIEDGKKLTQGCAIMRYLAKDAGMMPTDAFEVAKVDEVFHLLEEFQVFIGATMVYRIADETERMKARKELADTIIPKFFERFEVLLNKQDYFVGNKISVADIIVWKVTHWLRCGTLDGIPTTCVDNFKVLSKNYENVESHPKIKSWKAKNSKFYK